MERRVSIARAAMAATLLLGAGGRAHAQQSTATASAVQQSPDPNLPYYRGTLRLPPNPAGAYLLGYEWRDFRSTPRIYFNSMPGHRPHNAWYLGYNSEGTYLQDETTLNIYVLRGMDFSLSPIKAAADIPGLKNTPGSWAQEPGAQDSNATAVAQQSVDPNLPAYRGEFKPDPNPEGVVFIRYAWRDRNTPVIDMYMNTGEGHSMFYIGYNDQGTWMQDIRTGRMFLLKGRSVSLAPVQTMEAMPNGLKNAINSYRDLHQGSKQAATTPPAEPEHPAARAATPAQSLGAVPPGTAGGTQARIERTSSGITLTYTDASGEHRYKVRRPALGVTGGAAQQLNAIDTGGWLYVAADGASGILFNVTGTGAVTAMPIPAQALPMLAGHRPN